MAYFRYSIYNKSLHTVQYLNQAKVSVRAILSIQKLAVCHFYGNMEVYTFLLSLVPQKALICVWEATLFASMCTLFCGLGFM